MRVGARATIKDCPGNWQIIRFYDQDPKTKRLKLDTRSGSSHVMVERVDGINHTMIVPRHEVTSRFGAWR